jgi:predicted transglutaminase-like cysteine proteinase
MANRLRNLSLSVALGIAGGVFASPASAESMSARWSKSEALIGQPSALQAILAAQNGQALPNRTPQPMSYSRPAVTAQYRIERSPDDGATSGRPDVFGSVALSVSKTPLDGDWRRAGTSGIAGPAARYASSLTGKDRVARLEAVNRYVNDRVRFVDDQVQFGRADVWASASETLRRGKGDCEDYAIAKMQMLRRAGFAERDLYVVIVRDLVRRADHAVLVARAEGRMFVLDNGTDKLLDSAAVSDYRPIMTFASKGSWTHGYRREAVPVQMAENKAAAIAPALGN